MSTNGKKALIEARKPHRMLRSEYPILTFDADGKSDTDMFEEELRLAMQTMPPIVISPWSSAKDSPCRHFPGSKKRPLPERRNFRLAGTKP